MSTPAITAGVRRIGDVVNRFSPTESEMDRAILMVRDQLQSHPLLPGERAFMTRSKNYRIQITAPVTTYDPLTQSAVPQSPVVAQFRRYLYRTSDEKIIKAIEGNRYYGGEIFDAEALVKKQMERAADALVDALKGAPEDIRTRVFDRIMGIGLAPGKRSLGQVDLGAPVKK